MPIKRITPALIDDILGSKPEAYLGYGCPDGPFPRKIDRL